MRCIPAWCRISFGAEDPGAVQRRFVPFMRPFMKAPAQGTATSIHLASAPELAQVTGRYFANSKFKRSSERSYDEAAAAALAGERRPDQVAGPRQLAIGGDQRAGSEPAAWAALPRDLLALASQRSGRRPRGGRCACSALGVPVVTGDIADRGWLVRGRRDLCSISAESADSCGMVRGWLPDA
jgi:hypothetical protein